MKRDNTEKTKIGNYDVYEREGYRGWAIIIMPDGLRIDNYHGFPHIHFTHKGKKHKINTNNMEKALEILYNHIWKNEIINKKKITGRIIMITIRMIKKTTGKGIIENYKKEYGSIENLEKIIEREPENMKTQFDLEEWEYFINHPDEEVNDGKTIFRDYTSISMLEIELMNFIKHENPKSISELAKMIQKDISTVQKKINNLEKEGLVELKEGAKNSKIPTLNYDKIEIAI
ncbi:MAG: MarR family transcriptional regulator [Rickettsia sp.]|jgi:DNA-binding transcriptional regulator YhcF (GntR family)|nr:MarR family transcriptional regulator [Rickettsia sp.]